MNSSQNSKPYLIVCTKCNSYYKIIEKNKVKTVPKLDNTKVCNCTMLFLQQVLTSNADYHSLVKNPLFKLLDTELSRVLYS